MELLVIRIIGDWWKLKGGSFLNQVIKGLFLQLILKEGGKEGLGNLKIGKKFIRLPGNQFFHAEKGWKMSGNLKLSFIRIL